MKIELSVGLPFQLLFGWFMIWWPDQGPSVQNVLWNIFCDFGFKIHPVDRIFLQVERTFLVCHVRQKLTFLTHLIACLSSKYIQVN